MGEGNNDASLVSRVHSLLAQGQTDEALILLAQPVGERGAKLAWEVSYLRAWCAIAQERWEEAAEYLCSPPFTREISEKEALLSGHTERRRRPRFLLLLGEIAAELDYSEEAREHFVMCLDMLDERRMNVPELRLRAQSDLGALALQTGWPDQAAIHYATALRLCDDHCSASFLANLYRCLCEAYYQSEQFTEALTAGQQGLALLDTETDTQGKESLFLLMARVCLALEKFPEAVEYAQEAWQLADEANHPTRKATALLALAELFLKDGRIKEAREYCQHALEMLQTTQETLLQGKISFLYGKIAEAEWQEHSDRAELAEEAQSWYEQAQTLFEPLPAPVLLTEVLRRLALLLETRGLSGQALAYWKTVYLLAERQARR